MHQLFLKISSLYASTCFEHYVLIIRRSKLYYTASGIVTPVGGRPIGEGYLAQQRRQMENGDSKQMRNWKMQLDMKI